MKPLPRGTVRPNGKPERPTPSHTRPKPNGTGTTQPFLARKPPRGENTPPICHLGKVFPSSVNGSAGSLKSLTFALFFSGYRNLWRYAPVTVVVLWIRIVQARSFWRIATPTSLGERQGIAQKGVCAIDPEIMPPKMAKMLQSQCSRSRAVSRLVWTPFCVILWGRLTAYLAQLRFAFRIIVHCGVVLWRWERAAAPKIPPNLK